MANSTISPNMNLILPTVGVDPGPDWATNLNASLSIIDQHNHSSGSGVQITPNGLNISSDLSFQMNNALLLRASRYAPQTSPLSGAADIGETYVAGVDLYYNDVNGNQIQITKNGNIAGTSGSIANLVPPASVSYVSGDETFVFQSNSTTAANIDAGSYVLRNLTSGSFGLTLAPPTLSSNYTITLPAIPSSISLLTIDTSGNLGTSSGAVNATLNSLITASDVDVGGNLSVTGDAAIGGSTFTAGNSTFSSVTTVGDTDVGGNLAVTGIIGANGGLSVPGTATIGTASIGTLGVTGNETVSGALGVTGAIQSGSRYVNVAQFNAGYSLGIVRGIVSSGGSPAGGEGFGSSSGGTGVYNITYSSPFGDVPSVVVTQTFGGSTSVDVISSNNSGCQILIYNTGGGVNSGFNFIAIGRV